MTYRNPSSVAARQLLAGSALPVVMLAALAAFPAAAQQAPPPAAPQGDSIAIEEVVVTSRRREENLLSVPDSVTAFTSQQLENRRLVGIADVAALTSNVRLIQEQDVSTTQVYIRGIGSNRNQASSVAFAVDGVILPDSDASTVDLSDAERVEVLKGPQGALYGKGALAGAINIVTRRPTNQLAIETKASYGSDDTYSLFGEISGPIVGDRLKGRLSAKYNHTDGAFENATRDEGADRDKNLKLAGRLIFEPSDSLSFDLNGYYVDQKSGVPPYMLVDILGTTGGEITKAMIDRDVRLDSPSVSNRTVKATSLTSRLDLGFAALSSITAYDKIKATFDQDLDFTELNVATSAQARNTRGWSQEFRLTSEGDGPLRYIVSAYYQNTRRAIVTSAGLDVCFLGLVPCPTPIKVESGVIATLALAEVSTTNNQYAASGQINYDLTSQLELTAALRYDLDKPVQHDLLRGRRDAAKFDAWQPKLSLAYKPASDLMVYGTYSQGYKAGTFNAPPPPGSAIPLVVDAETSTNYELGVKTSLLAHRIRLTAAAFHTTYDNAQQYHLDLDSGGQATINIDKSRIVGFEAEALARVTHALTLNASFGLIDSKIKDFDGSAQYRGQPLPNSPKTTLNLGGEYAFSVGGDYDVTLRADYARFGKTTFQDFQNPSTNQLLFQKSYDTVDLQAAVEHGAWRLSAYGRNIFSTRYVTSAYSRYLSPLIFGTLQLDPVHPAPGAAYGVEVRARF